MLLLAALAIGWLVLRSSTFGGGVQQVRVEGPTTTSSPSTTRAGRPLPTTTTRPLRPPADVKVLPLNGSGVAGAAGRVGETLKAAGYNTLAADNARTVSSTLVQYAPGFDAEAAEVARVLQLPPTAVQPLSTPPPVADVRGAGVVVVVGPDLTRSLPQSTATGTTRRTTTATTRRTTTATTSRPQSTTTATPTTAPTATTAPSPTVTGGSDAGPSTRRERQDRRRPRGRDGASMDEPAPKPGRSGSVQPSRP